MARRQVPGRTRLGFVALIRTHIQTGELGTVSWLRRFLRSVGYWGRHVTGCSDARGRYGGLRPAFVGDVHPRRTRGDIRNVDREPGRREQKRHNGRQQHAAERGIADVRRDPFAYMYIYGLHVHKLAHFHDIVHGTRHDFYMNEVRIEFLLDWLALLERKGFDPAALETSELGARMLKQVVF